jgi:hypothetical protein
MADTIQEMHERAKVPTVTPEKTPVEVGNRSGGDVAQGHVTPSTPELKK